MTTEARRFARDYADLKREVRALRAELTRVKAALTAVQQAAEGNDGG